MKQKGGKEREERGMGRGDRNKDRKKERKEEGKLIFRQSYINKCASLVAE